MTRDWLLTLLVLSPFFLAAVIVILALLRKPAQNERDSRAAHVSTRRDGADQMPDASRAFHGATTQDLKEVHYG